MKKVIFITGYLGSRLDYIFLEHSLKDKFELIYFDYNTTLKSKIETIAKQLQKFINSTKLKKNEKISMIGFSVGGLISEYYLKFIDNKKVDKLITIYSPFKGTYLAYLSIKKFPGLCELKNNSPFIKKLSKTR
jgi:triacylglycerol esterase/lipase EstA (alpha/beta hydrolase family)